MVERLWAVSLAVHFGTFAAVAMSQGCSTIVVKSIEGCSVLGAKFEATLVRDCTTVPARTGIRAGSDRANE